MLDRRLLFVTGKWFLLAGDRQGCVAALREVRLASASARGIRDFKAAQGMLLELGEQPLDRSATETGAPICMAAALAHRRMSQWVLSTDRTHASIRTEAKRPVAPTEN